MFRHFCRTRSGLHLEVNRLLPYLGLVLGLSACLLAIGCSDETVPAAIPNSQDTADFSGGGRTDAVPVTPGTGATAIATDSTQTPASGNPAGMNRRVAGDAQVEQVLASMVAAYRQARTYADSGQIQFRLETAEDQTATEDQASFSVAFERPNKLRLHMYEAALISDGQQMRGVAKALPNEILALDAPPELTIESIYTDEILTTFLTQGIAGSSLQMLLLLDPDPLEAIFNGAEAPTLIESQTLEDQLCHRVQAVRADGKLILWIDQQTHALRRVEFPVEGLRMHFSKQGEVKSLTLHVDFRGAHFNEPIDAEAFRFEPPEGAKLVKEFDRRSLSPPPPSPSPLLGKPAPKIAATGLDGQPVSLESLRGKPVVLDFWFTTCPPCRASLPNLDKVYQAYRDKVHFVALSVDPADVEDKKLQSMFSELKVHVPIARDKEAAVAQALGVEGYPTMFLLGADGVVQHQEMGFNPNLVAELPMQLEKLLAGGDVYPDTIAEYNRRLAEYEQSMQANAPAEAEVAAASSPSQLKLTKLWSSKELERPGNIVVVPGQQAEVLVLGNFKSVGSFDAAGKLLAKHELEIPETDVVANLRTARGKDGKQYFVGFASGQPQVHIFDESWKRLASYPEDRNHAGIADVRLADLDGDGQFELNMSYWGVVGVQSVSLLPERLWSNRSMEHAFCLAVTAPDAQGRRGLWCAHGQGTLIPIDSAGTNRQPIAVESHFIRYLVAEDLNSDGRPELLGLSPTNTGNENAVGISPTGSLLWSYPLPAGVHASPIEMVTSGNLLGAGQSQWILAAADGSIHILAADGTPLDRWNYGSPLTGIAVAQIGGQSVLLVSTAESVDAWTVAIGG